MFILKTIPFPGEACPGNHYLVRFQDRLVWVMVLERGASFCTINIKGLELQETSCHTAEAARIDEIFETVFEAEKISFCSYNQYLLHSLTPVDSCYLKAYSDARNVLTGVIDTNSSTAMTMDAFLKSLVWVLLKYVNQKKKKEIEKEKKSQTFDKQKSFVAQKNEKHELKEILNNNTGNGNVSSVQKETKKNKLPPLFPTTFDEGRTNSPSPPPIVAAGNKKLQSSWGSMDSFTDSIFSDDGILTKKKAPSKPPPIISRHPPPQTRNKSPDIDELFDELDMGMPAFDVSKPKPQTQNKFGGKSFGNTIYKPQTNLAGSPDFKSPYSSQMSLPKEWRELPLDNSTVSRLLSKFPRDWFKHVLSCLEWSCEDKTRDTVLKEVLNDDTLLNTYAQLTMACYSIFDNQGMYLECFIQ